MNQQSNSPGFMYFKSPQTSVQNSGDKSGFLAFNSCTPPRGSRDFEPTHYSSPQNQRNYGDRRNWKSNRRFSGGKVHNLSSFNSPRPSYSPYRSSFNSSNSSFSPYRSDSQNSFKSNNSTRDISRFLHPSFTEDPWANFEESPEQKTVDSCTENKEESCSAVN